MLNPVSNVYGHSIDLARNVFGTSSDDVTNRKLKMVDLSRYSFNQGTSTHQNQIIIFVIALTKTLLGSETYNSPNLHTCF